MPTAPSRRSTNRSVHRLNSVQVLLNPLLWSFHEHKAGMRSDYIEVGTILQEFIYGSFAATIVPVVIQNDITAGTHRWSDSIKTEPNWVIPITVYMGERNAI